MRRINLAHVNIQGVNVAIFDADATNRTNAGRQQVLTQLISAARRAGLIVDKGALAFQSHGQLQYFGPHDLINYLAATWVPEWTHWIDVR